MSAQAWELEVPQTSVCPSFSSQVQGQTFQLVPEAQGARDLWQTQARGTLVNLTSTRPYSLGPGLVCHAYGSLGPLGACIWIVLSHHTFLQDQVK